VMTGGRLVDPAQLPEKSVLSRKAALSSHAAVSSNMGFGTSLNIAPPGGQDLSFLSRGDSR